jgi:hypothetical protein
LEDFLFGKIEIPLSSIALKKNEPREVSCVKKIKKDLVSSPQWT